MRNIDEIALAPKDLHAINEVAALVKERFPVVEIILFGSKARGTDDEDSDVDLLLLTQEKFGLRDRGAVVDAIYPLQLKHDVYFSFVFATVDEWHNGWYRYMALHKEVERDGVLAA